MKIHIITNLFYPDELAGASLFTDLAIFLKSRGHDVRVTTTFPYYPAWKLRPEDVGVKLREEMFEDIPVRRVKMYVPEKPTGSSRVKSDLSFLASLLQRAKFPGWQPDVVLTASPMFSQCLVQNLLYPTKRVPKLIVVQDFVVDAALELKMLNLPGLPWLLRGLENWAFRSAGTLFTISQPMLEKLEGKMRGSRRCLLVPNWIHRSIESEIKRQTTELASREPLTLFYSGNLGYKQGLPEFIKMFKQCDTGWRLRVHGGGAEMGSIRQEIANQTVITLGGVLDEKDYVSALRSTTACLITQKPGVGANFLPSKLLPALAAGTPVLAVCEASSPLGMEVHAGGFGEVVEPGDIEGLRRTLRLWQEEPNVLREFSIKSKARSLLYHRENILCKYEEELQLLFSLNNRL